MKCRICDTECDLQFSRTILGKYSCAYFYCNACGLLQTEEPYWLEEAYNSAIAAADTGLVYRNLTLSRILSPLLFFFLGGEGKYLDVAGGYGMFTRLMRDIGFDYYWTDPYCQNLMARGFEGTTTTSPFTAITAFEVLEHVPKPIEFIEDALKQGETRTIIFSTELFEGTPPQPESWWYYCFETGQHISFYQHRTLQVLGEKLGLRCYSNGSIHMLTDKKINARVFRFLTHPRVGSLLSLIPKYSLTSKTTPDHLNIMRAS